MKGISLRFLVVDDHDDDASTLAALLVAYGQEAKTVDKGAMVCAEAGNYHPHAIFLDIRLPDVDGFEVAKSLRQQSEFDSVLIVAFTALREASDRRHAKRLGFDYYLTKPVDFDALKEVLAMV